MNDDIKWRDKTYPALEMLRFDFNRRLNQIHDEALAKFRTLARSTGQRTRVDRVKKFSLEPDDHMKRSYDPRHPDYNSDHAEYLRERRARAMSSVPRWMFYR